MSALDSIHRALTEAYSTGVVLGDETAEDLIKAAVREFEMDAQAYPGELAMLRGLVRTLRVVVRDGDSAERQRTEVQRLLWQHATDDAQARTEITEPHASAVDTNRRAHLLHAIAQGGRWKSGTVTRWYQEHGYTGLDVHTARRDLAVLRESGAIVQHDEKGVRWFSLARRGGGRG
jgi:hypothetical protein